MTKCLRFILHLGFVPQAAGGSGTWTIQSEITRRTDTFSIHSLVFSRAVSNVRSCFLELRGTSLPTRGSLSRLTGNHPLCSASHVLPWIVGTTSLLVTLVPRLGGFGVPKCFQVFFAVAVTRRLRFMLHPGRVPQAAAGSVLVHGVLALPGHRCLR